ncbi:MAG: PorV/PorQ family protein [Elusimicrobia bacterium]|nr:PorV/PorQ family protein [Elusimicrobiota bacterium]MDE2314497.1 PorV/PorQ family protein [Elusimicrobiota bacterium]
MRLCAALAALAFLAAPARASDFTTAAVGTTGSQFLTSGIGARGIAMGGAYSATVNDATALYWNPAGLVRVPRFSASLMYTEYVANINYQTAQIADRINDTSVLAGGLRYQNIGSIPQTDLAGNSEGTFNPRDYVLDFGWAQTIDDMSTSNMDMAMGVAGHWIHSDYASSSANGFGGDIGILSHFYNGPFPYDFSFDAQNMGSGQKFDQVRNTLPFVAKFGADAYPFENLILAIEADLPSGDVPYGALGVEYAIPITDSMKAALRGGFNSQDFTSLGLASCLTAGVGLTIGDFSFDYAFAPQGVLGEVHNVSLSYNLPAFASQRYEER